MDDGGAYGLDPVKTDGEAYAYEVVFVGSDMGAD